MSTLALAATAWACVAGPTLLATPQDVDAGSEVQVSGIGYNEDLPVVVRLDALDGPILGEFTIDDDQRLAGSVTIPAATQPGNYVLIATQEPSEGDHAIIPSRALVSVVGAGEAALRAPPSETPADRTAGLVETAPLTTASSVLAGVGVAGLALFLAGIGALLSSRSRPVPEVARVKEGRGRSTAT
jgi:hypothetical protein